MKTQMQLSWLHIKMLDQSVKTQENGYRCNGSVPYDTCIYSAVTKVCSCNNNKLAYDLLDLGNDIKHQDLLHRPLGAR